MAVDFELLILNIVKPLVTNPLDVVVKVNEDEEITSIQILVHADDLGRVIGRGGNTANAIRTICYAGAAKENKRVNITIEENVWDRFNNNDTWH